MCREGLRTEDVGLSAVVRRCTIPGCRGKHASLGYCATHYKRFAKYGDPYFVKPRGAKLKHRQCELPGCTARHQARGMCSIHYHRWRRRHPELVNHRPREIDEPVYVPPKRFRVVANV